MTTRRHIILFLFLSYSVTSIGQSIAKFKLDTANCSYGDNTLNLTDKNVLLALKGAEKYIQSIIGSKFLQDNVWLRYCESGESGFGIYSTDIKQPKVLGFDTCYHLEFYVLDKKEVIGNFSLLINKKGEPMQHDHGGTDYYNQPHLIKGFNKHFKNQFKLSYWEALEIGEKKGFWGKPVLRCEIENKFMSSRSNEIFVKVKYFWSFFDIWGGGNQAILEINAETGLIEKEKYIPRMPG